MHTHTHTHIILVINELSDRFDKTLIQKIHSYESGGFIKIIHWSKLPRKHKKLLPEWFHSKNGRYINIGFFFGIRWVRKLTNYNFPYESFIIHSRIKKIISFREGTINNCLVVLLLQPEFICFLHFFLNILFLQEILFTLTAIFTF